MIVMSAHQISDLAYQIDMWSWNQIMTSIQFIVFVDASITLWSWSTADSCDWLKFSWKTLILWILIIIVQNIVLSQAVSYHKSCSSILQCSVFVRRKQLSVVHHFCHIVRAHLLEHDQINQLWEHIQDQNWSVQVLMQLWIVSSNHWTHVHMWHFIETSWFSSSNSSEIIQSSRNII